MVDSEVNAQAPLNPNTSLHNVVRLIALVILLGVVVYVFFISTSDDITGLMEKISHLSFSNLAIPIALSLSSYILRFIRWRFILKQLGHKLAIKHDLIWYLSGFALTMTPGKSGETIRSAFLLQAKVPLKTSLSAFVIERSFDLLIVGLFATLLVFSPLISLLLLIISLSTVSAIGMYLPQKHFEGEQGLTKISLLNLLQHLTSIVTHASTALKPKAVGVYALLGSAAWGAQGLGFYFIVQIFDHDTTAFSAISTYCSGLFIGAVSLIPGGIGVTEGSLAWLLQNQGLEQNAAILSALISRGCTLWLAVAIGCCALAAIIKGHTIPGRAIPNYQNSEGS